MVSIVRLTSVLTAMNLPRCAYPTVAVMLVVRRPYPREWGPHLMRHVLGVLGVLAAGVLLAVSAAMNWRFGYSLGISEVDKQIYGAASAAADCFKALVPFFFFAAVRNRVWSQAAASAVVWVVVTAYSLTSALGHAALNRLDTTGNRAVQAAAYKDLRAEAKRLEDQLGWIPQHRPLQTVNSEIDGLKNQRSWNGTKGCTEVNGKSNRDFCQQFHVLSAESASAQQAGTLGQQLSAIRGEVGKVESRTVMSEADPQAAVLAKLVAFAGLTMKVDEVQTALAVFVALLLEIGSGFGMFVAFSQWRLYDRDAPSVPKMAPAAPPVAASTPVVVTSQKSATIANDNRSVVAQPQHQRLLAPETDVERFYKERIETADGSSLTATTLYEDYCSWCEEQTKEPLALPTFGREFGELNITKAKIAGRIRYIGIALKDLQLHDEEKRLPSPVSEAA